jgi:hypothetical protein
MTNLTPPGSARPARIAGLVLIGVAVLALVFGVISLVRGSSSANDGASGTTSLTIPPPHTTTTTAQPTTSAAASSTTTTAPPTTTTTTTVLGTTTTGKPAEPTAEAPSQPLRVLNNSKIHGLADKAANDFRAAGFTVAEVGNYPQGVIEATTAYYRPGTPEEQTAQALAKRFPNIRVQPRFEGIANSSPGVIVIVTNNYDTGRG